jgi:CRISPR-associated protein Cas5h
MKVLVFDVWGDLAHFKKFYTTSSPLSLSFPSPPTIAGMLGALVGAEKSSNDYLRKFMNDFCRLSIQIMTPIQKIRFGINLLETKGTNMKRPMSDRNLAPRTLIRTEFVRFPRYRIYFFHKDERIYFQVKNKLIEHRTFFTLSLGLSELIANFKFVGEFDFEDRTFSDDAVEISSPILVSNLIEAQDSVIIEQGKKYLKEKIPVLMNPQRIVTRYEDVIFEPEGKTIKAKVKNYQRLEDGTAICFF